MLKVQIAVAILVSELGIYHLYVSLFEKDISTYL